MHELAVGVRAQPIPFALMPQAFPYLMLGMILADHTDLLDALFFFTFSDTTAG